MLKGPQKLKCALCNSVNLANQKFISIRDANGVKRNLGGLKANWTPLASDNKFETISRRSLPFWIILLYQNDECALDNVIT